MKKYLNLYYNMFNLERLLLFCLSIRLILSGQCPTND